MEIVSRLPFNTIYFRHWDLDDQEVGILVIKAELYISPNGDTDQIISPQPQLLFEDQFWERPNTSSVRTESDLAPFKTKTDLTIEATARSPEAKPLSAWNVSLTIPGKVHHAFCVFGRRLWEPNKRRGVSMWTLGPSSTTASVPLRYEYAYGGTVLAGPEEWTSHAFNPVGRGLLTRYLHELQNPIEKAQIGLRGELCEERPYAEQTVCGFGPLHKSWLPRLPKAGTFDEAWQRERYPAMPRGYSFDYWNAAPEPLQVEPYLIGNETVMVSGLRHEPGAHSIRLPGIALSCHISREGRLDKEVWRPNLDTVHINIDDDAAESHELRLVWRLKIAKPDTLKGIEISATRMEMERYGA